MKKVLFLIFFGITFCEAQISDFETIDFNLADNIAKLHKGASLKDMGKLVYNLTHKLSTDIEKFRAIHTWVCQNITGDYSQHTRALNKRRRLKDNNKAFLIWNEKYKKRAFKKLIKRKRTMCTGYAYIIRELCFLAGIEAKIIDGYARTAESNIQSLDFANHSWNAIKLNNKWYLCDATWAAGYLDENAMFIEDYNEGYFLADPLLFSKNHIPIKRKWLLNNELIKSEFNAGPIIYGEAFTHNATPIFPENLKVEAQKGSALEFILKANDINTKKISLLHTFRKGERKLEIENITYKNGYLSFSHNFKHIGYYDVHIQIENDIVASYTIHVTKAYSQVLP
ncbi:transglutaminase domain-containing protein [Winogradskyella litorisediminis]|uniref:Transglutaminase domain-containing protein n=1 Tax=Winogradskyella litorisediminis TaxID=1156618 RepID=A0ABW3NAN2_9FLAO